MLSQNIIKNSYDVFLSYAYTHVLKEELHRDILALMSAFKSADIGAWCSLYQKDIPKQYDKALNYCLDAQKHCNSLFAFLKYDRLSNGMVAELNNAQHIGQPIIIAKKADISAKKYLSYIKSINESDNLVEPFIFQWKNIDDLYNNIVAFDLFSSL